MQQCDPSVFLLKKFHKINLVTLNKNRISLISLISIACFSFLKGQSLDSCGLDNKPNVNLKESAFLNYLKEKQRKDFDFKEKKVAFITGNAGGQIMSKKEYFDALKKYEKIDTSNFNGSFMVILTEKERIKSGGYDVLISYWAKGIFSKKRLLKSLSKFKTD